MNKQQKEFLLCYVLAVIPELPADLEKTVLEVRMRIMNNGGRDITIDETKIVLEKMKEHKLVALEDGKIFRKVKLSPQFFDPMMAEFMRKAILKV